MIGELKSHWSGAACREQPAATATIAAQIFSGLNRQSAFCLLVMGTNFQIKVWEALLKIPPGTLVCYQAIGQSIGRPSASRAIGAAVGRNAIGYLIPCHRVIQKSRMLGGYRWGPVRKQAIVAWEAARAAA